VEYDITSLVLAPLRAGAAEAALEAARYRAATAVVRLGYEVRAAFLAVQASQRRLAIAVQALEAFALSREAAEELLRAGNVRELDVVSNEAAHERARVRVAEIELELVQRRERLQRLLGLDADPRRSALRVQIGPVPAPDASESLGDVEGAAVVRSLELAETRSRVSTAEKNATAARTEGWLPRISVGAIGVYDEHSDAAAAAGENRDSWRLGGGLRMSVPLFDRRQGTARAFEAEQARQHELFEGLVLELRSRARELERGVASAHDRARKFETLILPAQQRVLDQTLLQYNAMQVSVFDLLRARREQFEVELSYVETLREYWTARAALDALLAGVRVTPSAVAAIAPSLAEPAETGGH
jgi:outer membrane protein, heavy metal efflux system